MDSILRSLKNKNVLEVRSPHPAPDPGFCDGRGPNIRKISDKQKRKKEGKKRSSAFLGCLSTSKFSDKQNKKKQKISRVFSFLADFFPPPGPPPGSAQTPSNK